ncbi:MAG: preprotein translocase subunit SecE [Candidatus Ryanbacteria bacterium RIFCSPLOWO2_01_FULL_48_26]|uniref:Protein translocase subunit SecE n=1 Tax=Candidatus Ryanbacteria bacterium RIFCSPLOWO2_01_FULL_48_26 TaxID=1802126 RepID=A0A1G2GTB5_9BACT|nr:MAG: preprotein translocase subunit SecE [Candidatus Ryanbacteria bacterium RIFCSPLOWO2_01_FULL_48_26]OHB21008.1 MAG: preprotein translocase subunit SecE [Parcubacteria group bacterium RIFCSPHIGHO2_02_FULL_48_10b]
MLNKIKNFIGESRVEFRHVNWPTRQEAIRLTGFVIGLSFALAIFLGAFDYIFAGFLKFIVVR